MGDAAMDELGAWAGPDGDGRGTVVHRAHAPWVRAGPAGEGPVQRYGPADGRGAPCAGRTVSTSSGGRTP